MEGWRLPGAARHGIGFGGDVTAGNPFLAAAGGLQPDDTWFGDPVATTSLPFEFTTRKRAASPGENPSGRLLFEAPCDGGLAGRAGSMRKRRGVSHGTLGSSPLPSCQPASSSSIPEATQQIPSAALQAGRLSLDGLLPDAAPPDPEDTFAAEVWRIIALGLRPGKVGSSEYWRVLDLQPSDCSDLQAIQSKYRRLMRLLHPDKRRQDEEKRAGGKERCDLAVSLVQEALVVAKKSTQPDPQRDLKDGMRRMQETQRRQARMAMQRQASSDDSTPRDVQSLLSDISQALGSCGPVRTPVPSASSTSDSTTELIDLLANLRQGR